MKMLITLLVLLVLVAGCSEAPFDPNRSASVVVGSWGGVSRITYPGMVDEPITEIANINFQFSDDGSYYYREQYDYDTNSDVVYTGKYVINGSTIILIADYAPTPSSPFDLAGIFQITVHENAIHLYQIHGGVFPTIHELTLSKWVVVIPVNPVLGRWRGMSHVTYPNEVDAPTHDSLEVNFEFYANHTFTYGWVGDEISFPTQYEGIFQTHLDKIYLTVEDNLPYNSPLNLQGQFDLTIIDNTLRLYQHPEHIWPIIHDVQLVR